MKKCERCGWINLNLTNVQKTILLMLQKNDNNWRGKLPLSITDVHFNINKCHKISYKGIYKSIMKLSTYNLVSLHKEKKRSGSPVFVKLINEVKKR